MKPAVRNFPYPNALPSASGRPRVLIETMTFIQLFQRTFPFLCLLTCIAGCNEPVADDSKANATAASPASSNAPPTALPKALDARSAQLWSNSCALCHVDGTAGAPRVGDREAWQPRLAQGMAVLLKHTVEGLNDMPPLGYCMACENKHFTAMIEFMSGGSTNE